MYDGKHFHSPKAHAFDPDDTASDQPYGKNKPKR